MADSSPSKIAVVLLGTLIVAITLIAQAPSRRAPGVMLTSLDPAVVDDLLLSYDHETPATITFINRSNTPVDIYWISYEGTRILYKSGLAVGDSWRAGTFLTHPWLVLIAGTGTNQTDSGVRIAGFVPLTKNGDTAIITPK
jgi:hypothetical protein